MNLRFAIFLAAFASLAAPAWAVDKVTKTTGESVTADVVRVTATEVTVKRGASEETIPVDTIASIAYGDEPPQLKLIRAAVDGGNYEGALAPLAKLTDSRARAEVKQDIDFYRVYATAKLALLGAGDVRESGKQLRAFVDANPTTYHYLPASETLGDLFAAVGAFEPAMQSYEKLAKSPFPNYQVRGNIALGRALVAQRKLPEALDRFAEAERVADAAAGKLDDLKTAAILGKASCMAETGEHDAAIALVETLLAGLDAEASDLHAQAYVTLGNCFRKKPDSAKQALLAFLHVDVLYSSNAAAHAEALWNLGVLFNEIGQPDRAAQVTQMLKQSYGGSVWAQR